MPAPSLGILSLLSRPRAQELIYEEQSPSQTESVGASPASHTDPHVCTVHILNQNYHTLYVSITMFCLCMREKKAAQGCNNTTLVFSG